MNKTVKIEGMMCEHCVAHVKEALEALGCEAEVSLENGEAVLKNTALADEEIRQAVSDAGYEVTEIING